MITVINLVFDGQPVSKDNTRARAKNGHYFLPMKYRVWEDEKKLQFLAQKNKIKSPLPLDGELEITLEFYYKDRRFGDLGNAEKSICDALNKLLYHDDKQINVIHKYRYIDRENPRIEIEVLTKTAEYARIK